MKTESRRDWFVIIILFINTLILYSIDAIYFHNGFNITQLGGILNVILLAMYFLSS